ncbi:MAG: peptide ABC transporter substrate-binding protein, partial [Chlamydiota bacterium]
IAAAFQEERSARALRRMFLSLDAVRRKVLKGLKEALERKVIAVRVFRAGGENRIGAAVALFLTPKYEHLGESQLFSAAQSQLPFATAIDRSFCHFREEKDAIHLFYAEWQREDGHPFLSQDLALLHRALPAAILKRVESLIPATFAKCFEEDVMKNTVVLLKEVESCPTSPHLILLFDRVSRNALFFKLLIAREKSAKTRLKNQLKTAGKLFSCLLDRELVVGNREACVFQITLTKTSDLIRSDGAVHFALARQRIAAWIEKKIGKVRDYNGGLFEKKEEKLLFLKRAFPKIAAEEIETFFYSIDPAEQQALLPQELLCSFFQFFLDSLHKPHRYLFKEEGEALFVSAFKSHPDFLTFFKKRAVYRSFPSLVAVSCQAIGDGRLSFCLPDASAKMREVFKETLRSYCNKWQQEKKKACLRISVEGKVVLDPRRGGDRNTTLILRSLFEGLTRFDAKGKLSLALAKSYTLSSNQKTYTFTLRKSCWSSKDPITARDFEYAWKTALDPSFSVDFPELFYCIKNAELAKAGTCSVDEVGIVAKNNHTLVVMLEYPAPDLLERLAHTLFLPIPSFLAAKDCHWFKKQGAHFVSNGPFCLEKSKPGDLLSLKKNCHYFGKKRVAIDCLSIIQASTAEAMELFQKGKLDFVEIPNRMEGEFAVKETAVGGISCPAPKISWFAINTACFPLNNLHFRMALAASLNRDKLKELFSCEKSSALTPLPLHMTHHKKADFLIDYNATTARTYLDAAALELGLTKRQFPPILLMVPENKLKKSIAQSIKDEWQQVLGLSCIVESYPWHTFYQRRIEKKFQLAMVEWGAPTSDPLSILLAFKKSKDKINLSGFEDPEYKRLLAKAVRETDREKRRALTAQLEEMLIRSACVLPTFYERFWFFKKPSVKISAITPSFNAMPDFSHFSFL